MHAMRTRTVADRTIRSLTYVAGLLDSSGMDTEVTSPAAPFSSLRAWLHARNILLTDKQTCLRLFVFIVGCARLAGVGEDKLQAALRETYHPRTRRPVALQKSA